MSIVSPPTESLTPPPKKKICNEHHVGALEEQEGTEKVTQSISRYVYCPFKGWRVRCGDGDNHKKCQDGPQHPRHLAREQQLSGIHTRVRTTAYQGSEKNNSFQLLAITVYRYWYQESSCKVNTSEKRKLPGFLNLSGIYMRERKAPSIFEEQLSDLHV